MLAPISLAFTMLHSLPPGRIENKGLIYSTKEAHLPLFNQTQEQDLVSLGTIPVEQPRLSVETTLQKKKIWLIKGIKQREEGE